MRGMCHKKTKEREKGDVESSLPGWVSVRERGLEGQGVGCYNFLLIPSKGTVFSIHQGIACSNSGLIFSWTSVYSDA